MIIEAKEHEVYYQKNDYQQIKARYQREKGQGFTPQELLIIAKGFFIEGQFVECLNVIKNINYKHSTKVLFERQSLRFRAEYLLKRHMKPTLEDLQCWRDILGLIQKQCKNISGPPIQPHHINKIMHYKEFLILIEQRLTNKIAFDTDIFKQQRTLQLKAKKYEGFPIYLMANMWIDDFNNAISSHSQVYLSPINNFFLINDIFESYNYEETVDVYKNPVIFPGVLYQTIGKKYWNYLHSLINQGKQICPVKRITSTIQSGIYEDRKKTGRTQPLIPLVIKCQQQTLVLQLTHNKTMEEELYAIIQKRYGIGQFKVKSGQNLQIYSTDGSTQFSYYGLKKILHYYKVKLPKNVPPQRLRQLLKFQFRQLPKEYLKDPQNGLKGLENIGNSCYLNSCIQCLSNTQELATFVVVNHSLQGIDFDQKDGIVVAAFADLIKNLWNKQSKKASIYPRKFKKSFGQKNTQFLEKTQQDAHEFLLCLLNSLHEELKMMNSRLLRSISKLQVTTDQKRVKQYFQKHSLESNKSIIMDIFRGKIHNTMNCSFCKTLSHSYDVFLALTLPIPQMQSKFIDIYYCGWQAKQTRKYRIHLYNMKSVQDIFLYLKQVVKRKTDEEYYYIYGQINKQNLTFQHISLIASDKITLVDMEIEQLIKRSQKGDFIFYEMKKKVQNQSLAFLEYRFEKNGLILGFPKLMHLNEKQQKQTETIDFKRDVANNDRQNLFRSFDIDSFLVLRRKDNVKGIKFTIFDYIIQVIFKGKQKLFVGTNEIYEQLNDPNIKYSIYDCFDLMRQPEVLEDSWKCGSCKKTERVEKREQITQTNNILIIHLKRFKADYRKIKTMIQYPLKGLQIDRWIQNKQENDSRIYRYDLYAVCLHTGTAEYGHYKAYCKHFVSQKWYEFDDGNVQEIEEAKVVTPHAYMLFYKRTTLISQI